MVEFSAVKDRAYTSSVTATLELSWVGAKARQVHEDLGPLLLSLPERQPGLGWRLIAYTPIYFWAPDDPTSRNAALHRQILDRLALLVARMIKLDEQHTFTAWAWNGDYLDIDPSPDVHVDVLGGTRVKSSSSTRYAVPREADRVRIAVRRSTAAGTESWTQTWRRPR